MEIKFKAGKSIAELIIESEDTILKEDIVTYIPQKFIENFVAIAMEMNRFNGNSDVAFVREILDNVLSSDEREELLGE